ncbi:MAG: hypothetical protein DYH08_12790, partial [Actinobacteria bacterium ATB1]|nr:hypothetical protein [Actinobacteria bacterium ATB1]
MRIVDPPPCRVRDVEASRDRLRRFGLTAQLLERCYHSNIGRDEDHDLPLANGVTGAHGELETLGEPAQRLLEVAGRLVCGPCVVVEPDVQRSAFPNLGIETISLFTSSGE